MGKAPCPFPAHPECLEHSHRQILSFPGPFFQLGKEGNQVPTGNGTEALLFLFPGAKRIEYMHFVSLLPLLFNYFYHGVPVPLRPGCQALASASSACLVASVSGGDYLRNELGSRGSCWCRASCALSRRFGACSPHVPRSGI